MTPGDNRSRLRILGVCTAMASAALFYLSTGSHPIWWLTGLAAVPVFLVSERLDAPAAFAIATLAWLAGSLNLWTYFRAALQFSVGHQFLLFLLPSCVFGLIVLVYRTFVRRGALWQAALAVAVLWVSYQYMMAMAPRYRTVASIGYTQMAWLPVFHAASLAGIWGVSFGLFLLPASLSALLSPRGSKWKMMATLIVIMGAALGVSVALHYRENHLEDQAASPLMLDYRPMFTRSSAMIPMRDGVRLYTEIYRPKDAQAAMPFLIERGNGDLAGTATRAPQHLAYYQAMFPDKYIVVFQEIRGRYASEGQFVMFRPPRNPSDPKGIDEATDTYDTIDWLLKNVGGNNGRAGLVGVSYSGWLATMALLDPHPALKAICEQASPADMFLTDDFHHNGAFRLSYGLEYTSDMELSRKSFTFPLENDDTYDWYLGLGPLSNVNALYFHGRVPTWNNFVAHPNYDDFWQTQAFHRYLSQKTLTVPVLNVAGWWDEEDASGPVKIYEDLETHDAERKNYLAVGPWNHGGMADEHGTKLSVLDFGTDTAAYFRQKIEAQWFAFWLYDRGAPPANKATVFETGSNQWNSYHEWPPDTGIAATKLYFHANGQLSFDAPQDSGEPFDSYISDPAHPVPYRHRPIQIAYSPGSLWHTWLIEDQRFAQQRPDVLTWATPPLSENLTIAGDVAAHLFASTTGTDSDWIVKLIDVYPDAYPQDSALSGYELIVNAEVFRGRFYRSFEQPQPLVPNQVTSFNIDLHTNDHMFLKGHRIMVQVQSTWFPLIDRNPQTYVPSIFRASARDYQPATQRIYHSPQYPSNIELPRRMP